MKRFFGIILLMLSFISSNAQDIITFHNGTTAEGKVKEVTDKSITFVYKNEDVVNLIGTVAVDNIKFESGRIQQISPKITIQSPDDWKSVKVVYDKSEVMGLKSLGQIEKHSSGTWSFSITGGHFLEKTLAKIRKEAAKRGGCIVLIQSSQSKSGGVFSDGHASMTGEIFTY